MSEGSAAERKIYIGSASPGANTWQPGGVGELSTIRDGGTTGPLKIGFWRTHAGADRCRPDGSVLAAGNAPVHDAVLVLEGSGTVTIPSTGTQVPIEPGLIISHPQGIETHWNIDGPYLKKLFVEWERTDGAEPAGDIHIGHVADNPDCWTPSKWTEPAERAQELGESYLIRQDVAPDAARVGVWRSGVGLGGAMAHAPVCYSGVEGDTTIFMLEGRAKVRNEASGEEHAFASGDVIGLSEGTSVTWTNITPFVKTFFVVTKRT